MWEWEVKKVREERRKIMMNLNCNSLEKCKSLNEIPVSTKLPENENKSNDDVDFVFGSDDNDDKPNDSDDISEEEKDLDIDDI